MDSVMPDAVGIESRLFRVNYDTPKEVTEAIYRVYHDAGLGVKDMPQELLRYEVMGANEQTMD